MSRPMTRAEAVVEAPVTTVTVSDYAHQAYMILLVAFVVAPIVAGLDKYFNILTDWTRYLSPIVPSWTGIAASTFMMIVGAVEIVAGLIVAFKPSFGGYVVMLWLWGIIINLLLIPGFYDIALRDFGLSLGALALARLSHQFDKY
jgi:uncharacterized membrane protein HdeD (DUF308 family)